MTRAQKRKLSLAVNRGARLLDKKKPLWWKKIKPASLDMTRAEHCVLGQCYGDFISGLRRIAFLGGPFLTHFATEKSFAHGFWIDAGARTPEQMSYLAERWLAKVAARKTAARRKP